MDDIITNITENTVSGLFYDDIRDYLFNIVVTEYLRTPVDLLT